MNDEDVLRCIDDVFDSIEEGAKQVIYYHLERNSLKRGDIVDDPMKFHRIMHYLFGLFGDAVEEKIIDEFRRRFNIRIENGTLADYINRILRS